MSDKMSTSLRDALRGFALDSIYWPSRAPTVIENGHAAFYRAAADVVGAEQPILYLEFGVAHGKSMREMAAIFTHLDTRFYGFDSFVGLPENWLMHEKGAFSNKGRPPVIADTRVKWVQGWFQNTVPGTAERLARHAGRRVLVHFDADLYSSTLFLLAALWYHFDDYYFIFDDFIHDDVVALSDFLRAFPADVEFLMQTKGGGERPNPDQVFGHLSRRELRVDY